MANKVLTTSIPLGSLVRLNDTNNSPLEVLVQVESGGGGGTGPFRQFVHPAFVGTPDGSISAPWPTVNQALAAVVASGGGSIVLAQETYLDNVVVPLGFALQVTLLDYAGERAEFLNPWTWNCQDGDDLAISGCILPSVACAGAGAGDALLKLQDCTCNAVTRSGATTIGLVVSGQVFGQANEQSTADSVLGTTTINGAFTVQNTFCSGNVTCAFATVTKCFVGASRTWTAAGSLIALQQVEFGGTHGTPTAFVCATLQIDPYSQWSGAYPQPTAQLFTCTGTIVPTPRIPASSVQLLTVIDSGSTGDWSNTPGDSFVLKQTAGAAVECDFVGSWNAGDILEVEFWGNASSTSGAPLLAIFSAQVSLDNRVTWQNLLPAQAILDTGDLGLVVVTRVPQFSVAASASIALAVAPIVRLDCFEPIGNLTADYGNGQGFTLRCKRYSSDSSVTTSGELV